MGFFGDLVSDWAAPKCKECGGPLAYDAKKTFEVYTETTLNGGFAIWNEATNAPAKKYYRCKRCGKETTGA